MTIPEEGTVEVNFSIPAKLLHKKHRESELDNAAYFVFSTALLLRMIDQAEIEFQASEATGDIDTEAIGQVIAGLRHAYQNAKLTVDGEREFSSFMIGHYGERYRLRVLIEDESDEGTD